MGLVRDKTNLVIRICNELNFTIEKKKSHTSTKKTISKGKSATSGIKKRSNAGKPEYED